TSAAVEKISNAAAARSEILLLMSLACSFLLRTLYLIAIKYAGGEFFGFVRRYLARSMPRALTWETAVLLEYIAKNCINADAQRYTCVRFFSGSYTDVTATKMTKIGNALVGR